MKQMNNTCKEVLPALLDKTKISSIMTAWKEVKQPIFIHHCGFGDPPDCFCYREKDDDKPQCKSFNCEPTFHAKDLIIDKPAEYKVGDIVKQYWDGSFTPLNIELGLKKNYKDGIPSRILGKVEITEVFQIEMLKDKNCFEVRSPDSFYLMPGYRGYEKVKRELAKDDGFKNAEKLFSYMDKKYDLSSPKKFYVYKFKWL